MKIKLKLLMLAAVFAGHANADEQVVGTENRNDLSMTVYSNGLTMVQDQRQVELKAGKQRLSIEGISNLMNPSSALLTGEGLGVSAQLFDYALMSDANMLRLLEGREVKLVRTNIQTGADEIETATIVTTKPQLVLKTSRGIETNLAGRRIIFDQIPEGLSLAPAFKVELDVQKEGSHQIDLTYLSEGLSWKVDYIARLNVERTQMNIRSLAMVRNDTEVAYNDVTLNMVAGDVQRLSNDVGRGYVEEKNFEVQRSLKSDISYQRLGHLQLFKLPQKVSLEIQQTKQFPLLLAHNLDIQQNFIAPHYFNGQKENYNPNIVERPQTDIQFNNDTGSSMPAGQLRVYETDKEGRDYFTGELNLGDIAEGEPAHLALGQPYYLRIFRKQTHWEPILSKKPNANTKNKDIIGAKATYEVRVTNASDQEATVLLQERGVSRLDDEAMKSDKLDSSTYQWPLKVPAKGEASLTYTISLIQQK